MSVALVKQTIAGGELPTGPLYAYSRNAITNQLSVFRCSTVGVVEVCHIMEPIVQFTGIWLPVVTLKMWNTAIKDVTVFSMGPQYGQANASLYSLQYTARCTDTIGQNKNYVVNFNRNGEMGNTPSGADWDPAFIINMDHMGMAFFGKNDLGAPNYSGRLANKCIVTNNFVECYGGWWRRCADNYYGMLYVLLDPTLGIVHATNPLSIVTTEASYFRLNMPVGGTIRWFKEGYYMATDPSNNMFLYRLEDATVINGSSSVSTKSGLVSQLTGAYDPALPVEMLITTGI